ncbi:MAG TPA: CehA/McbA family metallohydrolase [Pirellulales bacterium]
MKSFLMPPVVMVLAIVGQALSIRAVAAERVLDGRMHHLRSGDEREWSEFPAEAEGNSLRVTFAANRNDSPLALRIRQRDVKQAWRLRINEYDLGPLPNDECPMTTFWEISTDVLRQGDNILAVNGTGPSDDVEIGDVRLIDSPRARALSAATVKVRVVDSDTGQPLPARLTVLEKQGSLCSVAAQSNSRLAVRPGVLYTADGQAEFGVPEGAYTVYAGRGFEYSIDSRQIVATPGGEQQLELAIRREVPLDGYVSCDTHVHTLTYSGHGDCSLAERLITLAGEGIELPIATDHNVAIDYLPALRSSAVLGRFTPVIGNEVTTRVGHFNVFPLDATGPAIDHQGGDWSQVFAAIRRAGPRRVIVLNHPRDLHAGFRPFDPRRHLAMTGENLDGWRLEANAIELVNSGAVQSDAWQIVHDWLALLNAGLRIAPVGSSDSHDVARSIVGQARTYIRCRDENPGQIDVAEAIESLLAGRVLVSYGLVADLTVNGVHGPGDVVAADDASQIDLRVRVLGPSWSAADEVVLLMNGTEIRREKIEPPGRTQGGVKFQASWKLDRPPHDASLVVVAVGPGVAGLFWPTAKPYQPDSPDWKPYTLGATGAIYIDCDGRPGFTSPREFALRLIDETRGDAALLATRLRDFDAATAAQAAAELRRRGELFAGDLLATLMKQGSAVTAAAVRKYVASWKASEAARASSSP